MLRLRHGLAALKIAHILGQTSDRLPNTKVVRQERPRVKTGLAFGDPEEPAPKGKGRKGGKGKGKGKGKARAGPPLPGALIFLFFYNMRPCSLDRQPFLFSPFWVEVDWNYPLIAQCAKDRPSVG